MRSAPASDAIWVANVICMPTLYVQLLRTRFTKCSSQFAQHAPAHFVERSLQREPAGTFVTAAAERLRDGTHADIAFTAQADAPAPAFDLAEEGCDLHA